MPALLEERRSTFDVRREKELYQFEMQRLSEMAERMHGGVS